MGREGTVPSQERLVIDWIAISPVLISRTWLTCMYLLSLVLYLAHDGTQLYKSMYLYELFDIYGVQYRRSRILTV
ncbi:hypothetical protein BP00DRAFT_424251 [Aspergillus indologenus CBS 114.80]|uniref:Uncharacterized protein n=1 Tax=Aspergillus indologenus CBS 114.80 TaxID=1450541 RepID=A0A2V5IAS2_9EURO|nr:hypothetical protein BP00DRAFT_424251 [Aspergillus indologenus CBS 114.80]